MSWRSRPAEALCELRIRGSGSSARAVDRREWIGEHQVHEFRLSVRLSLEKHLLQLRIGRVERYADALGVVGDPLARDECREQAGFGGRQAVDGRERGGLRRGALLGVAEEDYRRPLRSG